LSLYSILLGAIGVVFLAVLVAAWLALFTPIVCVVDTEVGEMRVRWLAAVEYLRPLPGHKGRARLRIGGKEVWLAGRKAKKKRKRAKEREKKRGGGKAGRAFSRCMRDGAIRKRVFGQVKELGRGVLRSAAVTEWRTQVSLPDPAANGMLYGGLAAFRWAGRRDVGVNFTGENSGYVEIRVRPHRIVKAVVIFAGGLPYRAVYREWRAAGAKESA
jgi:hypothetical protein